MPESDPIRVLVVDDHEHLRRLVQTWIEDDDRLEWVGEAVDGESGLAAVAGLEPDAVVLDVEMPGIGGMEVLDRLRADRPDVVVVLYTSDPSVHDEGLARGARDVFAKGDPITAILDRIVELVTARRR
jgi:DNA-binding NarL/FixJ family response regulator